MSSRTLFVWLAAGLLLTSCQKPVSKQLIGLWKVTQATEIRTVDNSSTTLPLNGYDDYWMAFEENGICKVSDRSNTLSYQWYLIGDTTLLLVDYRSISLDYSLLELHNDRMLLENRISYREGPDSTQVVSRQRLQLDKR